MSVYESKFQPVMERWSLALKIILLTTGLMFLLRTFMLQSLQNQIASLLLGIILVSIYIYMLIVIPSSICLEKDQLVIKRAFRKKCIPYSYIKDAFVYDGVQNDIRYFGSNGFLGYIGVMGSTHYGKYYSYVKNPNQQIFILTKKKNYLFSCENRDLFIKDLLNRL